MVGGENKIPVDRFEGGHEAAASLKSEPESDGGNRPPTISNRQGGKGGNALPDAQKGRSPLSRFARKTEHWEI